MSTPPKGPMAEPGPDEKTCPYCAETIKAAAVKCRYCHSDLTEALPTATDEAAARRVWDDRSPTPEPRPHSAIDERPPTTEGRDRRARHDTSAGQPLLGSFRLLRILVALCLVLALVTAAAWWFNHAQSGGSGRGPITSVEARDAGLQTATRLTEKILSYDWKTLAEDTKAAQAVMGPSFRAEYTKAMAGVKDQTIKNQVTLEAKAVATSIVSASEHRVVALVFVNQVTTAKGTQNQRLDQNRVLVTLTRGEGEWRVSKMDAF